MPPSTRRSRRTRLLVGAAVVLAAAASVVAYESVSSPTFGLDAAPGAGSAACARIADGYPDEIAGAGRTSTGLAGAAAWGDGAVVARCGLDKPLPTKEACAQVDGVDWVWRTSPDDDGRTLLVTYGRSPAVEVRIDTRRAAPDAVLIDLSRLVKPLRQDHRCLSRDDVAPPPGPGPKTMPHHEHDDDHEDDDHRDHDDRADPAPGRGGAVR
ncbi:DUF3515 family protein [Streptomyces angustmyceticus]|uniref:DUF3515 domain-containing protein n=1 Tax=Streptomyces angustmyceticus TaxID=285578 RepID=A0A5J4LP45_9ACTN|nr:DUF3515 family protein [Streptomyces angustmyceticus]UAL66987.1 DUF3515 domain-containing protein [Streptomyces angustmyceticus]GES32125.1 hypothetical protein San01_46120 [Streptomyces angustmyceticus]